MNYLREQDNTYFILPAVATLLNWAKSSEISEFYFTTYDEGACAPNFINVRINRKNAAKPLLYSCTLRNCRLVVETLFKFELILFKTEEDEVRFLLGNFGGDGITVLFR